MSNPPDAHAAPGPPTPRPAAPLSASEDSLLAQVAHFGGVVGPLPALVVYLVFKDRGMLTRRESKEALNWQITFTILYVGLTVGVTVVGAILFFTPLAPVSVVLGWLPWLLWAANAVLSIMGGLRVRSAGGYRYPFAIRLVK
jgi:uncharacterized Tic20 family protein